MNKFRLYTGSTQVAVVAARLKEQGWHNVWEGTEHVYFETSASLNANGVYATLKVEGLSGYTRNDLAVHKGPLGWARE